ncbi:MAG: hypothetical protein V2A63_01600 [Patescibacteria group bacterium]
MKKIIFVALAAGIIFSGCQKTAENWVGFYYPEGAPTVGPANCEVQEFADQKACQNWADAKAADQAGAEYFCGYHCKYDSSCQYACGDAPVEIPADWQTFSDANFSFKYPADFGSEFITPVDWPPVVDSKDGVFVCAGEIRVVGAQELCRLETSEGAAGSIYSNFHFSEKSGDKILILDFSIREPQCPNYPEPKMSQCTADQKNLNLDQIVSKIFTSFSSKK